MNDGRLESRACVHARFEPRWTATRSVGSRDSTFFPSKIALPPNYRLHIARLETDKQHRRVCLRVSSRAGIKTTDAPAPHLTVPAKYHPFLVFMNAAGLDGDVRFSLVRERRYDRAHCARHPSADRFE
jgi:hypothetical protein